MNSFNVIKKFLLITLTIFHCLKYFGLDDRRKFKYNILIIEIISISTDIYLTLKKNNLVEINEKEEDKNNNKTGFGQGLHYIKDYLYQLIKKFNPFFCVIFIVIYLILTIGEYIDDFSTIFITNIICFIFNEKDD